MRIFNLFLLAAILLTVSGCASAQNKVDESHSQSRPMIAKTGTYCMEYSGGMEDVYIPSLTLNEDNSFSFAYDLSSSYLFKGHYKIENNMLSANTEDGSKLYLFRQVDEETLSFKAEGSSDVSLNDERLGVPIMDGALFKIEKTENE